MNLSKIYTLKEYEEYFFNRADVFKKRHLSTLSIEENNSDKEKEFTVPGYSITAETEVDFLVDWQYSDGKNINWRERLTCPITGLCNRLRASYHLMKDELKPTPEDQIYITEQVTPFYEFLKSRFDNLVGSEFVGTDAIGGSINEIGVRHEDLTTLSFDKKSMDFVFSFDCLEHVPNYKKALNECLRVLKPGGQVLMSFPFDSFSYRNLVRAKIGENDSIEHLLEPEYHGDPINAEGCLSFYVFGWELLDEMRALGFEDVYAAVYWSDEFGYLGPEQISIIASKPRGGRLTRKIKSLFSKKQS